jgi:hypothetical protein
MECADRANHNSDHHSAALGSSNQVTLWGRNFEGQCGGGTTSSTGYPSPRVLKLPVTVVGLCCGYHFTLFATQSGATWGTGSNSDGQLDGISVADPRNSRKILSPRLVPLEPIIRASVTPVGTGCIAQGPPPKLTATPPQIGTRTLLVVYGAPPNAPSVTLVGVPHPGMNVGNGCRLYVNLTKSTVPIHGATDRTGTWLSTSVPVSSSLLGLVIGAQSAVAHATTLPLGSALTNGIVMTVGH